MTNHPLLLENRIQDYAWGSKTAIQNLVGKTPDGNPWAELWMGAHPKAPSFVRIDGETVGLDVLISRYPEEILGRKVARKFRSTLPYLFKVLAAAEPLSIQAHPDPKMAAEGFDRENRLGIPITAPERNYRDPRPKPEVICAIEPFYALNGFRPVDEMAKLLVRFCPVSLRSEIDALSRTPVAAGIRALFHTLMTLREDRRHGIIAEVTDNAQSIDLEEARWVEQLHGKFPNDIGILSPLLLNLIRLEPGEAMFLPAGRMHAYLYGTGIELMGNSDNVLRGGLTRKHVDVDELMRVLRFDPAPVEILYPVGKDPGERQYAIPVEEFSLSEIRVDSRNPYAGPEIHSAEIALCMEGQARLINGGNVQLKLGRGNAALIPALAGAYRIEGDARLFKASVPA